METPRAPAVLSSGGASARVSASCPAPAPWRGASPARMPGFVNKPSVAPAGPASAGRLSSRHPASLWEARLGLPRPPQLPSRLTQQWQWAAVGTEQLQDKGTLLPLNRPGHPRSVLFFFSFLQLQQGVRWGPGWL